MTRSGLIAGIETGGTKTIAAVAHPERPAAVLETLEIATTTPREVGDRLRAFLGDVSHVGVAAFGPLDLDPASPTYRCITATPKPRWAGTRIADLLPPGARFVLVSDVTGAAVAEHAYGATAGLADAAYVTVGTGVGVGAVVDGAAFTRRAHPELGHMAVRRHGSDRFDGVCPFHGDCLEGLASGPAVAARWGRPTTALHEDLTAAVGLEAFYLGQLVATVTYAYRPDRVTLGGGVLKIPGLLDAVRGTAVREIAGALGPTHPSRMPESVLVTPTLGDLAGVTGALTLAATLRAEGPLPLRTGR